MKFEANDINNLYQFICEKLLEAPDYVSAPRGMKIHELYNAKLVLCDPTSRIVTASARQFSKRYCAAELAFYFAGSNQLNFIAHYAPFWRKVSDDGLTVNSCYGKRLLHDMNHCAYNQFSYALTMLLDDKDSRKAVMMIYNPEDAYVSKDNPCTIMLHAMIRNDELMLTTYMRSNDIWLGTPYDIAFFTIIQELLYVRLKEKYPELKLGSYTHLVGSLHLYDRNFEGAGEIVHSMKADGSSHLPAITKETFDQMNMFLKAEEQMRLGHFKFDAPTDPFLQTLTRWLYAEA